MAYTKKTWEDFPNTSTPITADDLNNIEDGIEALDTGKVNVSDIVDNLTSTDATKVLSAKQGKVLNDGIEALYNKVKYDSGSNANGSYERFVDGSMIIRQRYARTLDIQNLWDGWYYGFAKCLNYPVPFFGELPTVIGTVFPTTSTWCFGQLVFSAGNDQTLSNPGSYMAMRPSAATNVPIIIEIIAIGKWK